MREIRDAVVHNPFSGAPTFTFKNRLRRFFWSIVWFSLGSWTPIPFHGWRRLLLRVFGAKLHPTVRVYGSARVWSPSNLEMAAYSTLGPNVICYTMAKIKIGHHVVVSQGAHLCCGSHDISSSSFQLFARPIEIEPNAWIAAEAFVGPGVRVGEGAVLAARGAAFGDLAPWTVYRGNPAVAIRDRPRFDRKQ